jgi:hypothetical protein
VVNYSQTQCSEGTIDPSEGTIGNLCIPFLPLPNTFDPTDSHHWALLSTQIEEWLMNEIQTPTHPQWAWGCDVFWLTFIAAYPMFPQGRWLPWNPIIPVQGKFIESWLNNDENQSTDNIATLCTTDFSVQTTLSTIWETFHHHITLFFPFPLVSSS